MSHSSRTPRITREQVLTAALKIIDAEGVEALSMRRLGRACGVQAMSLYHHVPDKAAVIQDVIDMVLDEVEIEDTGPEGAPPRRVITSIAESMYRVLLRHPNLIPALGTHNWLSPSVLRISERIADSLRVDGCTAEEAAFIVSAINAYLTGTLVLTYMGRRLQENGPDYIPTTREAALAKFDPDRYPAVTWMMSALTHGYDQQEAADMVFSWGLQALLDAVLRTPPPIVQKGSVEEETAPAESGEVSAPRFDYSPKDAAHQ